MPCQDLGVPYNGVPCLSQYFTFFLDVLCLLFFLFFKWSKTWYKYDRNKKLLRTGLAQSVLSSLSIISGAYCLLAGKAPYPQLLLRPLILGCLLKLMRLNMQQFIEAIRDSANVIIFIFCFVEISSVLGYYLFRYTFEGVSTFGNLQESSFNMLILLTTANFPDIMLPAY